MGSVKGMLPASHSMGTCPCGEMIGSGDAAGRAARAERHRDRHPPAAARRPRPAGRDLARAGDPVAGRILGGLGAGAGLILGFSGFGCHSCYSAARDVHRRRARPHGRGALSLTSAPPMRIFPLAINGCSVNRQLSMTRPQALPPSFFLLAPSLGRLSRSPKRTRALRPRQRTPTVPLLPRYCSDAGSSREHSTVAGACLSLQTRLQEARPAPKIWSRGGCTS